MFDEIRQFLPFLCTAALHGTTPCRRLYTHGGSWMYGSPDTDSYAQLGSRLAKALYGWSNDGTLLLFNIAVENGPFIDDFPS